jgi:GntR family transcriptional regulator
MIDRGGSRHTYQAIAWAIREQIHRGELRPGDAIPSLPAIQKDHDVSNPTAQAAVKLLKSWGLVRSEPGRGTYVLKHRPIVNLMTEMTMPIRDGARRTWKAIAADYGMVGAQRTTGAGRAPAPADVTDAFGFEADTSVAWRQRLLLLDDRGVQIATSYYAEEVYAVLPELAGPEKLSTNSMELMARAGFPIAGGNDLVYARPVTQEESVLLSVEVGAPVTEVFRVANGAGGEVLSVERMVSDSLSLRQRWNF